MASEFTVRHTVKAGRTTEACCSAPTMPRNLYSGGTQLLCRLTNMQIKPFIISNINGFGKHATSLRPNATLVGK